MIKRVLDSHLVKPVNLPQLSTKVLSELMPNTLKSASWVFQCTCMQYMFLCCVFHRLLFCTVHIIPSLTCLGSQHPVDPHHSTECINRTKYTVGTVGISDIILLRARRSPLPPCPRGYCVSLVSAQPSSARRGLRGLFSSASESHCVVSAFPRGSWALPCDHAEILYALANGLL